MKTTPAKRCAEGSNYSHNYQTLTVYSQDIGEVAYALCRNCGDVFAIHNHTTTKDKKK